VDRMLDPNWDFVKLLDSSDSSLEGKYTGEYIEFSRRMVYL